MSKKDKAAHEAEVVEPQAGGVPPDGEPQELGDGQSVESTLPAETQAPDAPEDMGDQSEAPEDDQVVESAGDQSEAKAPEMHERTFEEKNAVGVQSSVPARTHVPGVGLVDVSHPEKK